VHSKRTTGAGRRRLPHDLRSYFRTADAAERYLSLATDHADLERRIRAVERSDRGPALVTFNH
jgi:hypothetical protein